MLGNALARTVAAKVLHQQPFLQSAIILRERPGGRNEYGEWMEGTIDELTVQLASEPVTGQARNNLPSGLRDHVVQKFHVERDVPTLRYGMTDGDVIVLGKLGQAQNIFSATSIAAAQGDRDTYSSSNPMWLESYLNTGMLIKLAATDKIIFQTYDGEWHDADRFRATEANRWGSYTEIIGTRIEPTI